MKKVFGLFFCMIAVSAVAEDSRETLDLNGAYGLSLAVITSYPDDLSSLRQALESGPDFAWLAEAAWPPKMVPAPPFDDPVFARFSAVEAGNAGQPKVDGRAITCTRFGAASRAGLIDAMVSDLPADSAMELMALDMLVDFGLIDQLVPTDAAVMQVCSLTLPLADERGRRQGWGRDLADLLKADFGHVDMRIVVPVPSQSFVANTGPQVENAVVAYAGGLYLVPRDAALPASLQIRVVSYLTDSTP
jgi:hypothetical protein